MKPAALLAVAAIGCFATAAIDGARAAQEGEIAPGRAMIASFSLVDHSGRRVTERDFRGRFMLVFFGYSSCPEVCPTDLQVIGMALRKLGKAGDKVQPIFVTLDPERDTGDVLARYAPHFHPGFVGLTGTPDEVALAAETFGVIHVRVAAQGGRYTIDHSAFAYLLGPDARLRAAFAHGMDAGALAAGIARHLKGAKR